MPAIADPPKAAPAPVPAPAPAPQSSPAPAAPAAPTSSAPTHPSAPSGQTSAPAKPENPFAAIDKAVAELDKARPTTTGKPPPGEAPKPAPAASPAAKPEAPKPVPAPELRKQYEQTKADLAAKEAQIAAYENRIKEFEARGKDTDALQARLKQLESELESKSGELRAYKFEASPEFKKNYEKPWLEAGSYALTLMQQLQVVDPTTGDQRQGTPDDFKRIYHMPAGAAFGAAREMFGDASQMVMQQYFRVKELERTMSNALDEEKQQAVERNKADEGARIANTEKLKTTWHALNKEMAETEPEYHDGPEEKEYADLREKGYAVFDHRPKSSEELMVKNAHIRQRVAAFPVLQAKLARANQEIARLKSENEALNNPNPQPTRKPGGAQATPATDDDWATGLRKAVTS